MAYVVVAGAAMLVALIGVTALTAIRIEARSLQGGSDLMEAMYYAQTAIEMGRLKLRNDPNWRTNLPNGIWDADRRIGDGVYTLEGIDPIDGLLANVLDDPLVLKGTGVKGDARYKLQVRLQATAGALSCLEVPVHAGSDVVMNSATVTSTGGPLSANASLSASSSTVGANVEAVSAISGGFFFGTKTSPIPPRAMPESTVFDFYTDPANGTAIDMASIPKSQGVPTIQDVTLSNLTNPYGSVNPNGIYFIQCAGSSLRIKNAVIVGTLVVLDPGTFTVSESINWQPAVTNYPALVVRGDVNLAYTNLSLTLNSLTYPSLITGLIYASSDITTSTIVTVTGVLVAGADVNTTGTLDLTYSSTYLLAPPPGFTGGSGEMEVVPGSWKRLVNAGG